MSHTILFIGMLWSAFVRILNCVSLGFLHSVLWLAKTRLKAGMALSQKLSIMLVSVTLFSIQNYIVEGWCFEW